MASFFLSNKAEGGERLKNTMFYQCNPLKPLLNMTVKLHLLCILITASEFGHETGLLLLQNTGIHKPSSTSQHQIFILIQRSKICQSIISSDVLLLSTDRNKSLAVH